MPDSLASEMKNQITVIAGVALVRIAVISELENIRLERSCGEMNEPQLFATQMNLPNKMSRGKKIYGIYARAESTA